MYENALYEQCDCGYLGKKLDLVAPDNLYENSNKKEVSIINELGIDENKIKVTYKKLVNNKWTDIEDVPSSVGNYKAVFHTAAVVCGEHKRYCKLCGLV